MVALHVVLTRLVDMTVNMATTRGKKRFLTLVHLISYFSNDVAQYYWQVIDNNDWSLIDEALLLEMECSLTDVTLLEDRCDL